MKGADLMGASGQNQRDTRMRVIRHIEENCPYASCFRDVDYHWQAGVLRVHGSVGSFYLKQVLQTFLKDLEGVERIENSVDVVNSRGLSEVHPKRTTSGTAPSGRTPGDKQIRVFGPKGGV